MPITKDMKDTEPLPKASNVESFCMNRYTYSPRLEAIIQFGHLKHLISLYEKESVTSEKEKIIKCIYNQIDALMHVFT